MKKLLTLLFLAACVILNAAPLFENGKTSWKIYIPEKASPTELYAAEELSTYLRRISRCYFDIARGGAVPDSDAIVIGTPQSMPAVKLHEDQLGLGSGSEQKLAVYTLGGNLYLAGREPRGALYAVYTFLQDTMGVRWFWPSSEANGEFMIYRRQFELPELAVNRDPAIFYRGYHFLNGTNPHLETWLARNFGNIIRAGTQGGKAALPARMAKGIYIHGSGHNIVLNDKKAFQEHPEWFAEVMGKRTMDQICWNNSEVEDVMFEKFVKQLDKYPEYALFGFYPEDNQNYCRCAKCRKTDVSTNWFRFLRRLTDRLHAKYPHLRFTSIAYQGYLDYPKCDMDGYAFIEFAPYARCFVHDISHQCAPNKYALEVWSPWLRSGIPTGVYGYEFDILSPSMMIPVYHWLSDQARFFRKNNVQAVIPEIPGTYASKWGHARIDMRLAFYLYSRLMWDPDADVNALIRDFCNYVYPSAADEMYAYHTMMDRAWSSQKQHFSGYFSSPITASAEFITPERIARAFELFRAASEKIAKNPDPGERGREKKELDFEKKQFAGWVKFYWQNAENVLNVPQKKAVKADIGKDAAFHVRWSEKGVSLALNAPHADQAVAGLTAPDGSILEKRITLTDGRGSAELSAALKNSDCRRLRITLFKDGREVEKFGSDVPYVLYFNKIPAVEKKILVCVPDRKVPKGNMSKVRGALMDAAWQPAITVGEEKLNVANLEDHDIVAVRMNGNDLPVSFFREKLMPYVKGGGIAVLSVSGKVAFEKIFGSPAFRLKWTGRQEYSWKLRYTQSMQPGDWLHKPDNLEKELKTYCTPYSGYEIPAGSKWRMLATMRKKDGSKAPYILEMPYGKGCFILTTGSIGLEDDGQWMVFGSAHQSTVKAFFNNMLMCRKGAKTLE